LAVDDWTGHTIVPYQGMGAILRGLQAALDTSRLAAIAEAGAVWGEDDEPGHRDIRVRTLAELAAITRGNEPDAVLVTIFDGTGRDPSELQLIARIWPGRHDSPNHIDLYARGPNGPTLYSAMLDALEATEPLSPGESSWLSKLVTLIEAHPATTALVGALIAAVIGVVALLLTT
jgi:hypothetical protein